jgi:trichothecene 3-O-acetyltransferase
MVFGHFQLPNMHGPAIEKDLDGYLDILGQQPAFLKLYTQICFCFSVADASSHSAIINTLTNGLERVSVSFPWLAGQVVNEGSGEGNSGIFKFKPLEKTPRLVVKDLRHNPQYQQWTPSDEPTSPSVC